VELISKETISCLPPEVKTNKFIDLLESNIQIEKLNTSFHGNIYLLVDRGVYSASESFAAFAKVSHFATLIGTSTGGDGLCYSPIFFVLPNSKLVIRLADSMGINLDGTPNAETHTKPDIYIDFSKYKNNEELIDYLLENLIDHSH